jgi:TRAP-type C4-dicarboxylate transport system permease small subunit
MDVDDYSYHEERGSDSLLFRIMKYFTGALDVLGQIILVLMMLLTVADVALRYFLNSPILGSTEITEYMMVCLVLGAPFCTLSGKSISMELLYEKFPKRIQYFADAFTDLCGLVAIVFLSWALFKETVNAHSIGFSSAILGIPASPFFGVLAFSEAVLGLSLITLIIRNIVRGVRG